MTEPRQLDETQYKQLCQLSEITLGGRTFTFRFSKRIRKLTLAEFNRLLADIAVHDILVSIEVDQDLNVIDGKYRLLAAHLLNLHTIPINVRPKLTEAQKEQMATDLNLNRRQMEKNEVTDIMIQLRQENKSLRQIGEILDVSHETVRSHIKNVTEELPDRITGKDGKKRPAKVYRACVFARTISELASASDAIKNSDPERLPNKTIDLKRLGRIKRDSENERFRNQVYADVQIGNATLFCGDFREKAKDIADDSAHLVLTDPPYSGDYLYIWNDLGLLASRVLKPGGLMLAYSGKMFLPEIINSLSKHLDYFWLFAIHHRNGNNWVNPKNISEAWKPVLGFVKPPFDKYWKGFSDMISGGKSKDNHEWEQSIHEATHYIRNLCPPGGTVLDPMMGSGTNIIAAVQLGCKAIGIDIDPAAYGRTQDRLLKDHHTS